MLYPPRPGFLGSSYCSRIVTAVHFDRGRVYTREILTHSEYDEEKWKR